MHWPDLEELVKRCRRGPLHERRATSVSAAHQGEALHGLLPHRPPFLLIDRVLEVDLAEQTIAGERCIQSNDPILAGHFPGTPVYPGVLQVEAMGQLALCLGYFVNRQEVTARADVPPPAVRALRILQAVFIEAVLPGDRLAIHAKLIEDDGMTATVAGQIYKEDTLCSLAIQEVYFVE